jgi:cation/acetate symporter
VRVEFDGIPWLGISGIKMAPWFHVQSSSAGVFGVCVGFVIIVIVSLMTKPYPEAESFLHGIRRSKSGGGG